MTYAYGMPGEPEFTDFAATHQASSQTARDAYLKEYGIDYHDDPKWEIGNERHQFWLRAFEKRQGALIVNPHGQGVV